MSLFQSKFVRRFIDFHWNRGYKTLLWANLIIFSTIFGLLLVCATLVHYPRETDESQTRQTILAVNSVLVLCYVPFFEIRQLLRQRKNYFREINNWNDIFFLVTFIATVSSDFAYGTMEEDSEDY